MTGIDDSGHMAGNSAWQIVYWAGKTSTPSGLGTSVVLPGGSAPFGGESREACIGGDGSIVGEVNVGGVASVAATFTPGGSPAYLWNPGGTTNLYVDYVYVASKARGHWAGWYSSSSSGSGAVVDGTEYPGNKFANAVNDSGIAVGQDNGSGNAIILAGTGAGTTLGTGWAAALNNATVMSGTNVVAQPQIIGYDGPGNPTLWDHTNPDGSTATTYVAKNLNTLLPPNSGWSVTSVAAINNAGCMAGTANYSGTNSAIPQGAHGVILVPDSITRDGNLIMSTNNTVCVGQQINLTNMVSGVPTNQITSYKWKIPGANNTSNDTAFYDYEPTITNSCYTNLFTPTNHMTNSYCNFYWSAAGTNTVSCTTVIYGQTNTVTATLNVLRPSNAQITATQGVIAADSAYGSPYLHFGIASSYSTVGMKFLQTNSAPLGFAGTNQWVQVINSTYVSYNTNNHTNSGGCDTTFPYGDDPLTNPNQTTDSPDIPLPTTNNVVSESFTATMYLMWQPNSTNALVNGDHTVWVPLRSYQWNWSATATNAPSLPNSGTGWGVETNSYPSNANPTNVDATNEPTWTINAATNWVPPFHF